MSRNVPIRELYRPSHDEAARHGFVAALKGYLNGPVEARLARRYADELEPAWQQEHGRPPADRDEATRAFAASRLYQLWGASVFASQDLLWETVGETCERLLPEFAARTPEGGERLGRLELDPDLAIPAPIRDVEIHRQPGGYFDESDEPGLLTALKYFGTVELYRAAKGMSDGAGTGEPGMGRFILDALERRFPDLAPAAVLDLGCGPGTETVAYKTAFPEAEVWGLDLSAPFLRFGHCWAEDQGLAINFRQADARATGFDDESFDLVVSNILFHETWHDILPAIMAEARRVLRPGGVFLNVDIPYQPERLAMPRQVTNHWQVVNNGEPFWTGFADTDVRAALESAGFAADRVFADYDPIGQGVFYVFGARR